VKKKQTGPWREKKGHGGYLAGPNRPRWPQLTHPRRLHPAQSPPPSMLGMPDHPYEQQELYAPPTTLFDQLTAAAAVVAATDSPVPSEPLVSMCTPPQILLHPAPRQASASFSFPPVPAPSFGEWLDSFPPHPRESVTNAVRNEYLRTYRSAHPPPPPPPPPSSPTPPQHMSRFVADYTLEIALPEWPVLNLVMYPNGCVHLLSDGRGVGMFTTDRVPAATRTRVGILQQPEVTQVLDDTGEITYSQRGGVAVELVQAVGFADLERVRENAREAGKSCMKLVGEDKVCAPAYCAWMVV
jgi:hypothetical protein